MPTLIGMLAAAGLAGWAGHPWIRALIDARVPQLPGPGARWVSRPALTLGSSSAGFAWMIEGPVILRLTLVLAGILAVWLALIDLAIHRLPDPLVAALALVLISGYALLYITDAVESTQVALAAVAGGIGVLGFGILAFIRRSAMGLGDVKLAGALGIGTGWFGLGVFWQWILGSFLLGGAVAALLLVTRRVDPKDSIAFGPWMILAAAGVVAATSLPGVTH